MPETARNNDTAILPGWPFSFHPPIAAKENAMPNYYVATLAHCVVVEAANESEARRRGHEAIAALDRSRSAPIEIRTVRLGTPDEVDLHGVPTNP
jgi:hypothetical protein